MATDDGLFGEKPFHFLSQKQSAVRKAQSLLSAESTHECSDDSDQEENILFLEAMQRDVFSVSKNDCGHIDFNISNNALEGKNLYVERGQNKNVAGICSGDSSKEMDDETRLFLEATRQVTPLFTKGRDIIPVLPGKPKHDVASAEDKFLQGEFEFSLYTTKNFFEGHIVGLDPKTLDKLRSGFLSPEAHLDLHGLNAAQAFDALRYFIRSSWYKGLRTVLVIPGKGNNSPNGVGVLRIKLQGWLTREPFKRAVLAFCTARPEDGGTGGVYILLRKDRKKGKS